MDRQEFEVTVRETLEGVEHAIERLALDGVEPYPTEVGLRLMFDDGSFITLTRNDDTRCIDVLMGEYLMPCYYDSVEEQWYCRSDERPMRAMLGELISTKLTSAVSLPELA